MKPIKGLGNKSGLYVVAVIGCLLLGILIGLNLEGNRIEASTQTPGSIEDPLASKSYVDTMINQALQNIQVPVIDEPVVDVGQTIDDGATNITNTSGVSLFVVEFVMAGQSLIVEESGEVILRSGAATAIGNAGGNGISDVTTGIDIMDGQEVPWNHLIIVPRTDGRGLYITQDAYIMVKGHYSVEN